jgi:hypothetical protein
VEANQKSLELIVVMDSHKFKIATDQTKRLEKEKMDLDVRLHSQVDDLKKSTKTIEFLQFND